MRGEPIEAARSGLEAMIANLRNDPYALETVWISIITFDREARVLTSLGPLEDFEIPEIHMPDSGATHLGLALELLADTMESEIRKGTAEQRGDWRPMVFLMTDGKPSDLYLFDEMVPKIKAYPFGGFIACAVGPKADPEPLTHLTDTVVCMDTMDGPSFQALFSWVSASVSRASTSLGTRETPFADQLPPPPPAINLVGQ